MSDDRFDARDDVDVKNGPSLFLVLSIVVAAVIAIFIAQNRERAEIQLLFFTFNSRVWVAIAVAIALGMLLDRLVIMWWRRARKQKERAKD